MRTIADIDFQLLRRFVETGSEEAFSQLVESHVGLVYSVCLRETHDPMLAQDLTQAVFLTLFRKAPTIRKGTVLAGWLFNTSRFVAKNAMRRESRRKAVEQELIEAMSHSTEHTETWQAIDPLLHEAIASLGTKEREIILLRYFEDKSIKEVGLQLNTTEHAAQMRVSRALKKMKHYLRRNGVAVPVALLTALLAQRAVHPAPLLCRQAVGHLVSEVVAGSTTMVGVGLTLTKAHIISQGVIKSMFITKLKVASVVAALGVTVAVGVLSSRPSTSATSKGAASRAKSQNVQLCAQHLRQVALAVHQFLPEHDNLFPLQADDYKKALLPYTDTSTVFTCPDDVSSRKRRTRDNQSSFSFNRHLEGVSIKEIKSLADVVMLYEGQNERLDFRHGGQAQVAFGDGHTELVSRQRAKSLRWKP